MRSKRTISIFTIIIACLLIGSSYSSDNNYTNNTMVVDISPKTSAPPTFSIDSPSNYSLFGKIAPNYSLTIEGLGNFTWYEFIEPNLGVNSTPIELAGTDNEYYEAPFNQTMWDSLYNGTATVRFYVNNSLGELAYLDAIVRIDIIDPSIDSIDSPLPGAWFNSTSPSYSLTITEANLDLIWYTLDGGTTNYTGASSGTINSTAWSNAPQDSVTITFYVNDSAGNWDSASVGINKDSIDPSIDSIDSPSSGAWFNSTSPSYSLTITEANLDLIWYTLDGGTTNYTGTSSGTINSTAWSNAPQDAVTITFYVNDSAGNVNSAQVVVNKDVLDPTVSITSPIGGEYFDATAPSFTVEIADDNLDTMWYTIDGGATNIIFTVNGTIDQNNWTALAEGFVTIIFYANDSAGNVNSAQVVVDKDTSNPILVLNTPVNNTYWNTPPPINITVYEPNLDFLTYTVIIDAIPYIYSLNNNTEVFLNPLNWSSLPQGEFLVSITSYDNLGHHSELRITLYKDTVAPSVTINSPANNTFWNSAPFLNITAIDPNLDTIWYSVDNVNITLQNNEVLPLNDTIWSNLPAEGKFEIQIYANDSFGYLNDNYMLTLYKDVVVPTLIINSPLNNTYHKVEPIINVTVLDPYFDLLWYQVEAQEVELINNTSQQLLISIWDSISEEDAFTIYFFANDSAGNLNDLFKLDLNKDVRDPVITIINPDSDDLFGDIAPDFEISISESNLNQTWYMLYNQTWNSLNYTFNEFTGTINQTAWEEFWNGTVTIRFYANDTLNNLGFIEVTIRKNIFAPIITIVSPESNDLFGIEAPNITLYKAGLELDTTWYTIDNGATNYTFFGLDVVINQAAWDNYGFGDVIITFYVNDSLGEIGYDTITIRKDPDSPEITIFFINPSTNNTYWDVEPTFRVSVYEPNNHSIWYRVGLTNVFISNNTDITLQSAIWDNLPQGIFTIEIFANDTLGYINDTITLIFKKDTLAPQLIINQPNDFTYYNSPPPINITVFDPNSGVPDCTYTVTGYSPINNWLDNNTEVILNQTIWNNLPEGEFQIQFTSFDIFGHRTDLTITLYKDTKAPVFETVTPNNSTCHNTHPLLKISYLDPNLDKIYYKVGVSTLYILNDTEQLFDSSIWDGLSDGSFTIEFYANDTFGEFSLSVNLTLIKDTTLPLITVNSPANSTYYSDPPIMDITMSDLNRDTIWYTVMGTKVILSGVEAFNLSIWNSLGQGEFQINIFANDSAGNINDSLILTLYKDTVAPLVSINLPLNNTHWNSMPTFNVGAYDPNLFSISYQVVGYSPIILSNNTDDLLKMFIWYDLLNGIFFVDIFAEDSLGNINDSIRLTLYKDTVHPVIDINLPQPNDIYGDLAPSFTISVTEDNLNTSWYILIGESTIILFTGFSGTIDQSTWDLFGNGTVSIRFYANDTAGNIGTKEITVQKNIFDPIITITSPGNDDLFGVTAPNFTIYKSGPLLQSTWYTLDNGMSNITFTGLNGTINQVLWDNFGFDIITLRFYINDSFGKIGFDEISIRKDPDMPIIIVNTPNNYTAFASSPFINLTIDEDNLDKVWYRINDDLIDITDNVSQFIDFFIWDSLPQGDFNVELFANDTIGNVNNINTLYLSKDTIGPNITIILPTENQKVDRSAPYFELSIFDENNISSSWYTIDLGETTPFTGLIGRIDPNLWEQIWDNLAQGAIITIRFYAMDTLGNENYTVLTLIVNKPVDLPKFLSNLPGLIFSVLGLVAIIPITLKMPKTRYYKSISNKDKKKVRNVLITAGFFLFLLTLFFIF